MQRRLTNHYKAKQRLQSEFIILMILSLSALVSTHLDDFIAKQSVLSVLGVNTDTVDLL